METNSKTTIIRGISLIRRLGSILTIFIIFILLFNNVRYKIQDRLLISDLKNIEKNGISKLANVDEEYKIEYNSNQPQLTFNYNFTVGGKIYKNEYTYYHFLPKDSKNLIKIFTVHYLINNPNENYLNIKEEIENIENEISNSSIIWLIVKALGALIFGIILITQIRSLIYEIRNVNKIIEPLNEDYNYNNTNRLRNQKKFE